MAKPRLLVMRPSTKVFSFSHLRWLLLLLIPAGWCFLTHVGALTFVENKSLDWRFQYRGERASPVKVVHVNIDSLSLSAIGGMPWSRDIYARVADALLTEAKVKMVAFDIVFSDAGLAQSVDRKKLVLGNAEFGRFLRTEPPVVLAAGYGGHQFLDINDVVRERELPIVAKNRRPLDTLEPPELPSFETSIDPDKRQPFSPPVAVGLIDTLEGGTRRVPAWAPSNQKTTYFHLAVQLARIYWDLPVDALRVQRDQIEFVRQDGTVHAVMPLQDQQMLEVNWFTRWRSPQVVHAEFAEVYEYADMLKSDVPDERRAAQEYFAQEEFKGAVALVGPVDSLLQDVAPTSLDPYPVPKVGLHGNLLKTIVSGSYLHRFPVWMNDVIVFGLTIVVAGLTVLGAARNLIWVALPLVTLALYAGLVFQWFEGSSVVFPFTAPLGAALTTSFVGVGWQLISAQKAKGRIKGMFSAYVSPELVERMIDSAEEPQLGGHDAEITAYFSDIQGFSSFSEKLGSGRLVELMNEYLTACTDIVQAQGGTLDKYIGDAVVAMFGAPIALPDHAYRACVATQLVHQKLGELRAKWTAEGNKWPEIVGQMQSRIGLNTGECMIGNMGSRTRFNYTMMGDNVNLAARMESGSKSWGAYTMVTHSTKLACEKHGKERVIFRSLGQIKVMGRSQAVPIYEIMGLRESLAPTALECRAAFEQGLAFYHARDWKAAIACFAQRAELEPNQPGKTPGVKTNPSLVYLEIAREYQAEPPPLSWAGVYEMTEK